MNAGSFRLAGMCSSAVACLIAGADHLEHATPTRRDRNIVEGHAPTDRLLLVVINGSGGGVINLYRCG